MAGLVVMDRWTGLRRLRPGALTIGILGFVTGVGCSYVTLLSVQNASATWVEPAFLILSPLSIVAATVAGYSIPSPY